jgi:hypothetical protein
MTPELKDNQKLTQQQTEMFNDIDFSGIPSSDEFQKIKIKPQNRWFNSMMALLIIAAGTCVGVTIGLLVSHFA